MERIFENIVRSMESKEEVSSHPPDGFDERGRARRGEEASKNWAGSWSRKNARADDARKMHRSAQ